MGDTGLNSYPSLESLRYEKWVAESGVQSFIGPNVSLTPTRNKLLPPDTSMGSKYTKNI